MTSKQDRVKRPKRDNDTGKRLLACLVCGLLAASLWWLPVTHGFLHEQMREIQDYHAANDMRLKPREDLVFLGIDASSLKLDGVDPKVVAATPTLTQMASQWPWDRRVYAATIDRLAENGARLIVLDLVFAQPATPEEDAALEQAITRHRDRIVLASAFTPQQDLMNMLEPIDPFLGPLEDETAVGYVNFWTHAQDSLVKRSHFERTLNEANHEEPHPDEPVYRSLASVAALKLGEELPEGEKRFRMARVSGEKLDAVYQPRSLHTIFVPQDWKTKYDDGQFFRDKIVFIGPAAPTFQDNHDTPAGRIYGAQLHMHVLGAILDDAWYEEAALGGGILYFVLIVSIGLVIACLVVGKWGKTLILSVVIVCGLVLWFYGEQSVAYRGDRLLGSMAAAMTFAFGVLGAIIWQAMTERARRQQLYRQLQRSMSPDVADAIVQAPDGYYRAASGNRRQVTVLFADVRNFTNRSEQQDASELVSQLNEYLGRMVEVIFSHGGSVDKFIGDAIMATWGVIEETGSEADSKNAVAAAQKMLSELKILNAEWMEKGLEPFHIGVGLHRGEAIVGEVGSDQRTDFTVIGDSVNLASRIEGMTKAMGVELLISSAISDQLDNLSSWLNVGMVRVKGKDEGVLLWTAQQGSADELECFQSAKKLFQDGNFSQASELLEKIGPDSSFIGLVNFYQLQINHLRKNPVAAESWDGVLRMNTK